MHLQNSKGIIIRTREYGEGHQILSLYTLNKGKISVLAKGVKKTKSRLASLCHLFSYGDYLLYQGKSLYTLTQGEIIRSHHQLREDLWKLAYATYFCELVDLSVAQEEVNENIFQLLLQSFLLLQEDIDPFLVARFFEIRFLAFSGYAPHLGSCVLCQGNSFGKMLRISAEHGGIVCCQNIDSYAILISQETLQILKRFLTPEGWSLKNLRVSPKAREELQKVLKNFLHYHLPYQPKSLDFLASLQTV